MNADSNNNEDVRKAVATLTQALKDDPEYRLSWVANIAMQFKDRAVLDSAGRLILCRAELHDLANKAAEGFIDLLCKQ